MRFGSLFSGIGGLDLGLERAGMECAWQVEIDEWCRRVLARHWPDVPRFEDAKTFPPHPDTNSERSHRAPVHEHRGTEQGRTELRDEQVGESGPLGESLGRYAVDLICGGFPCQPVSLAGKRRGQDDERWLWPEFARIVRLLRPRFVLVENVPGLLTRGMGDVLGDLAASGYDTEWDCIPAAAVGAPHLRYRVFIVGHQADAPRPDTDSLGSHRENVYEYGGTEQGRTQLRYEQEREPGSVGGDVSHADGRGREGKRSSGLLDRERSSLGDDADGRRGAVPDTDERRRNGWPGIFGTGRRPQPEDGGWWATEPDVGRVAHGIPSRVDRLRGLGNAVVPQVAEWIGRRLMEVA